MLEKIFLQILNMSFTASFVIIFVLIARLLLKKSPKIFSYALWGVVLFRLICPFSFESVISLLPFKDQPIPQSMALGENVSLGSAAEAALGRSADGYPIVTEAYHSQVWLIFGSYVWLLGIAILLIYSIFSLVKLQKRLKRAVHERDNIYLAEHLDTPFVMGIVRPKIYLPTSLTEKEKRYILLHEEMHIRRFDHVVKILSFFVLCLHWFNPLAWVAFFVSGRDMEMSCDESVIRQLGNDVKKEYSSSLLTLATGRRIIGGTPLAFGEGDTKGRIKNVLNYKKPAFWMILVSVIAVLCVAMGLMTNPKDEKAGFEDINAVIVEIDVKNQTMTVEGIDENSVIGDKCILTWEADPFITVATNSGPKRLSINDFSVGDHVVLFISEVQESYPTRAKATTIQLQPKEILVKAYSAENLWNARTEYAGNNSAVGKLIELLPVPEGLQYDHFKLHTSEQPYDIEIVYSVPTKELKKYDTESIPTFDIFRRNALLLLALVDNAEGVRAVLTDGEREVGFINAREWADYTVGKDVRDYSESPEKLQELLDFSLQDDAQGELTFWVKPDEPPQVIGDVAAKIWLKSFIGDQVPAESRISDYTITKVNVIEGEPKAGTKWENIAYQYVVQITYDITTATEEYFAPGDGVSGKGTFKDLFRELCVKAIDGGSYQIVSVGTGGGEQEFNDELEVALTKAILEQEKIAQSDSDFVCESHVTLATNAIGPEENVDKIEEITVYAMVLTQKYNYTSDGLSAVGGSHIPAAITFEVNESGKYTLKEYWIPRDGTYYVNDIQAKFPSNIWNDALNTQKYFLAQIQNCYAQTVENKILDTSPIIESLFETMMSAPATSSNPRDYINAHKLVYRELTYYGNYTLLYVFSEFLKGGQFDLKGHLMRTVMDDLIGGEAMPIAADNGQEYFDAWCEHKQRKLSSIGDDAMRENYPKSYLMLTMLSDND